ncbi:Sec-independent protein translocase protein TatB [Oxalobacteraceae bacterium R-40]|uniref:Sec-independent protein translocase protein TatB n=1 Tax=Keguizhuia sedimenti TaxID=3064264 RepID=A0ABU1BPW3_9BURK|nr:Sec-independent protein translocase protein TatB [Oxalobacteraceae bacterium R-40]
MIDLGLSKLAIIGVVALIVIGPEKLPKVARTAGSLLGRAQRYINDVKAEVGREIELEELRKMQKEMQDAASEAQQSIAKNFSQAERELNSAFNTGSTGTDIDDVLREPPMPDQVSVKAKDFRQKKLHRTSAIPSWYKRQHGHKSHVISGAARVAKFRPRSNRPKSQFFH